MRFLVMIIAAAMLTGCASTRRATSSRDTRDSTRIISQQVDSIYRQLMQRDSIYYRDSIYIKEKGDTVTYYVERLRYAYKIKTDTIYTYKLKRDTVYAVRTDSIRVTVPTYIEKPRKWYDTGAIWLGRMCCLAFLLWVLFLHLKRKF